MSAGKFAGAISGLFFGSVAAALAQTSLPHPERFHRESERQVRAEMREEMPFPAPEWRTWTSPEGVQITGYLRELRGSEAVIVRRDGRVFSVPLERFSADDRSYIAEWAQLHVLDPARLRQIAAREDLLPRDYEIPFIEARRPAPGKPLEAAAIQTVLDFYAIPYDEQLDERIAAREVYPLEFIQPRDLINVLEFLPITIEVVSSWDPYEDEEEHEKLWEETFALIRAAISREFPVIVGYRPEREIETPEFVGVAVGYTNNDILVLEPGGSSRPVRFHTDDFQYMFAYAMFVFPTYEPDTAPLENLELDRDFLNRVSRLIRQVPAPHPELLVEIFQEDGMQATLRDVNRTDNRTRLMATRQFARTGGIPLVHDALNNGRIVVLPQEYKEGLGFVMIYGRTEDGFFAVDFLHGHHGYRRGHVEAREVARRWITRAERAYRLDLIQIVPPPASAESYATPPPRQFGASPPQPPEPPVPPKPPKPPEPPESPEPPKPPVPPTPPEPPKPPKPPVPPTPPDTPESD